MSHRPYFQRALHVLSSVGVGLAILAAAPMAEAFRSEAGPRASGSPAAAKAPLGALPAGDLVARLSLPRLAVDAPVYEGVTLDALSRGAGHLPGTAIPGEEGGVNHCVIAIPRDSSAARLVSAHVGDVVLLRTPFGVRSYRVSRTTVVAPEAVETGPTRYPRITLVTPYPEDAVGPAPLRLAVVLERT
jgi:sortase A